MRRDNYNEIAEANHGLREVVIALADHFKNKVPGSLPTLPDWFFRYYVLRVNTHIHKSIDGAPVSTDWTDTLCFLPSIDLVRSLDIETHRVTEEEKDPVALFKSVVRRSEKGSLLLFQNIFVVVRTESGKYSITVHKYPSEFFHFIVMDDSELLSFVVRNQIMINGIQLELPPEAHLSDFTD